MLVEKVGPMNELHELQEILQLPNLDIPASLKPHNEAKFMAARSERLQHWLHTAAINLSGFAVQPCVMRRSTDEHGKQTEVRRWSEEKFLPLSGTTAKNGWFLSEAGQLFQRRTDGRRVLRCEEADQIVDDIYEFDLIDEPSTEQLRTVRSRAVDTLYPVGYRHWTELSHAEQEVLVGLRGNKEDAIAALMSCQGEERIHTIRLFFSEKTYKPLRQAVLQAGVDGEFNPGAEALPWLMMHPDWNVSPSFIAMTRSAIAEEPEKAWELTKHPNDTIRLHMADLIENTDMLFNWLDEEASPVVRQRILTALQVRLTPVQVVKKLRSTSEEKKAQTIGWVLNNWQGEVTNDKDWRALNAALFLPLGAHNKKNLKSKLASQGKLDWRARLFT